MVSLRVDVASIDGTGVDLLGVTTGCAEDAARVTAAFGVLAAAVLDGDLAGSAGTAGRQWATSVAGCAAVVGTIGTGLTVAGSRYDEVEAAARESFSGSAGSAGATGSAGPAGSVSSW